MTAERANIQEFIHPDALKTHQREDFGLASERWDDEAWAQAAAENGEKAKGRKSKAEVRILNKKRLSEGWFGKIFEVECEVVRRRKGGQEQRRRVNMVIKEFKNNSDTHQTAEIMARRAVENYLQARERGLKVFTTYRLAQDHKSVLMTNGNSFERACVSSNDTQLENFGLAKLSEIDNWDELTRTLIDHAKKAAKGGVAIPMDVYFFLVSKSSRQVDFILGDYDNVEIQPLEVLDDVRTRENLAQAQGNIEWNIKSAKDALGYFIHCNVEEPKRTEYLEILYPNWGAGRSALDEPRKSE